MHQPNAYHPGDLLARFNRGATAWVLGSGMLSLHATVFAVAMTGMTLWNIYDAPSDLWVADVLRRWGTVLCFHAILLAAGWIGWRLLKAEQAAIDGSAQPAVEIRPAAEPAATVPLTARLGLAGGAPGSVADRAGHLTRRAVDSSAALGNVTAQRSRRAFAVVTERWTTIRGGGAPTATSGAPPVDPSRTWPEGFTAVHQERSIVVAAEETVGPAVSPPPAPAAGTDVVLDVHGFAAVNGHAPATNGAAPTAAGSPPRDGFTKDARWTWVETAAAAWLARREVDPPASVPAPSANGNHPAPDAPAIAEPRTTDTPTGGS